MGGNYRELAARASHVLIAARNAMLSSQPVSDAIFDEYRTAIGCRL